MNKKTHGLYVVLWACTLTSIIATIALIATAPLESRMGMLQKIFYIKVPSAYSMYLSIAGCFLASGAFLYRNSQVRDALARACAELAVVYGAIVLVAGSLWASYWGRPWVWEPRLTTTLMAVLIYLSYVVLRNYGGESTQKFAAALGFLGALTVPIIHVSVKKWGGQHPQVLTGGGGGLDPAMWPAFGSALFAFTLLTGLLIWSRTQSHVLSHRIRSLELDLLSHGQLNAEEGT